MQGTQLFNSSKKNQHILNLWSGNKKSLPVFIIFVFYLFGLTLLFKIQKYWTINFKSHQPSTSFVQIGSLCYVSRLQNDYCNTDID